MCTIKRSMVVLLLGLSVGGCTSTMTGQPQWSSAATVVDNDPSYNYYRVGYPTDGLYYNKTPGYWHPYPVSYNYNTGYRNIYHRSMYSAPGHYTRGVRAR